MIVAVGVLLFAPKASAQQAVEIYKSGYPVTDSLPLPVKVLSTAGGSDSTSETQIIERISITPNTQVSKTYANVKGYMIWFEDPIWVKFGIGGSNLVGTLTNGYPVQSSIAFRGAGLNDMTVAESIYSGSVDTSYAITISGKGRTSTIDTPKFVGTGLNDLSASGAYDTNLTYDYLYFWVEISDTGANDKFDWWTYYPDRNPQWVQVGNDVTISSTSPIALSNGVSIAFAAVTGHTKYSTSNQTGWEIYCEKASPMRADKFSWSRLRSGSWTLGASNVPITGAAQTLENNLSITFANKIGHEFADAWSFDVTGTRIKPSTAYSVLKGNEYSAVFKDALNIPSLTLNFLGVDATLDFGTIVLWIYQ